LKVVEPIAYLGNCQILHPGIDKQRLLPSRAEHLAR
jgi:hypothetical protein